MRSSAPASPPTSRRAIDDATMIVYRLLRHAPDVIAAATRELLELWGSRTIRPVVGAEFPLAEVEQAHALVESRRSVGKVVLVP